MDIKDLYKLESETAVINVIKISKKKNLPSVDDMLVPCIICDRAYTSFIEFWHGFNHAITSEQVAKDLGYEDRFYEEEKILNAVKDNQLAEYLVGKDKENRPSLEQLMQYSGAYGYFDVFGRLDEEGVIDVLKVLDVDKEQLQILKNKEIDSNSHENVAALAEIATKILETPESLEAYKNRKTIKKSFFHRDNGVAPLFASLVMLDHGIYYNYKTGLSLMNKNDKTIVIQSDKMKPSHVRFLNKYLSTNSLDKVCVSVTNGDEYDFTKLNLINEVLKKNHDFKKIQITSLGTGYDFSQAIMKQQNLEDLFIRGADIKFSADDKLDNLKKAKVISKVGDVQVMYDFMMNHKPKNLHDFSYLKERDVSCFDEKQTFELMDKHPDLLIELDPSFSKEVKELYNKNKRIVGILDSYVSPYQQMIYAINNKCLNRFLTVFDDAKEFGYKEFMGVKVGESRSLFSRMKEEYGNDFIPEFEKAAEFLGFKDRLGVEFKIIDEAKKGNIVECLQSIDEDKRPSFASLVDSQSIFNFEKNVFEQIYDNNPHTFARKANQILDLYDIKLEDLKAMKANDADNHILPNLINVKTQANAIARRKQQIGLRNLKAQSGKE